MQVAMMANAKPTACGKRVVERQNFVARASRNLACLAVPPTGQERRLLSREMPLAPVGWLKPDASLQEGHSLARQICHRRLHPTFARHLNHY